MCNSWNFHLFIQYSGYCYEQIITVLFSKHRIQIKCKAHDAQDREVGSRGIMETSVLYLCGILLLCVGRVQGDYAINFLFNYLSTKDIICTAQELCDNISFWKSASVWWRSIGTNMTLF